MDTFTSVLAPVTKEALRYSQLFLYRARRRRRYLCYCRRAGGVRLDQIPPTERTGAEAVQREPPAGSPLDIHSPSHRRRALYSRCQDHVSGESAGARQ